MDINSAPFISLCLDGSILTSLSKSARLDGFARYCVQNIIKEELIAIYNMVVNNYKSHRYLYVRQKKWHVDPKRFAIPALCCSEADEPINLEQPTLNHEQSNTISSAVLVDFTRTLQGTNQGSGLAMEESENVVGSLDQLFLYADEHYLAGKLPLGHHLGNVPHGVEECHQRNVGPLRFHASQLKWTGYHRLWPPDPYTSCAGSVT
ncbi:uncharacterized protein TNCV_4682921 [Trichonephila clavipes]|nr:uncharacterized protein TNCV_4682921 [Trichonephila clavipes]